MLRPVLSCLAVLVALAASAMGSPHNYPPSPVFLEVESGSGVPSSNPNVGAGTLFCHGTTAHHPAYGPITVNDLVLGAGTTFDVTADTVDLTGLGAGCGDFQADVSTTCVGTCTVTFPPGLDGTYVVYVQGTMGSVTS